ncbi:MAG: tRNA 5-methylaminomethyl-2-thiouridine biosynthesis bifunctional protein MnmC [Bacteroidetes bacterium ADurb.BinA174]|nr:MAG: tRNA 5-methylaminomethyl-2-thiouridine biosynthesis bifunctional protein MnmC [Bacteroidetes bacterium ADurb.BinA174]
MNIKFEITEDGSHTLFVPELNEHYHSTHGAIQESMHVFIDAGLRHCVKSEIKVLEIGFGTGLNAFLTLLEAERTGRKIDYTTLEFYPLLIIDAEKLNYAELTDSTKKDVFRELHKVEWGKWSQLTLYFSLLKMKFDFSKPSDFDTENKFDVIFFDAFAPEKQPEMWVQEIFDKIYSISSENAILTTYCAKGSVRRMLQTAGFVVERLPGPPGKREILRARK